MKYKRSANTDLEILKSLATQGEADLETIAQKIGKDYTTVLRRIRELEKNKIVELSRLERTEAKGKERKIYRITIMGLYLLSATKFLWENIDTIAQNHKNLLITFSKWDLFVKSGFRSLVVERLITAFSEEARILLWYDYLISSLLRTRISRDEQLEALQHIIDSTVFGLYALTFPGKPEEIEKEKEKLRDFWQLLKTDREIDNWVSLELERLRIRFESDLAGVKRGIEIWKQLAKEG